MKTGFVNAYIKVPLQKYYSYHGTIMPCNIQPNPDPFLLEDMPTEPFPIYETLLKVTTIYQCGESGWPPNLYAPLGYNTCDPGFVVNDDEIYLYTKTMWGAGAGQAIYNKESLLPKLIHKVVAIQNVEVHMKGEVFVYVPGTHYFCGPGQGRLYIICTYTENSWQSICLLPGIRYEISYIWNKCKPPYVSARNWDMEYLEEKSKIGFRVDQCTETDPLNWGVNRTRCYHNYCVVRYKNSLIITLGFQSIEWDIGPNYVTLYGRVLGAKNGYFIRGFQLWKKETPGVIIEKTSKSSFSTDEKDYSEYISGLTPSTEYKYKALLRNTGTAADTIFGIVKGFTTKN